jgi:hypothetical protein
VIRDTLLAIAFRRWKRDGWVVRPRLRCSAGAHVPGKRITLALVDEEANVVDLFPHPDEKAQPVPKTLLHELVGHVLLDLDGRKSEEDLADALEDALWTLLTPSQRRQLGQLAHPV